MILRPIRSAKHEEFVSQLLEREARWFKFPDGVHLAESGGPIEWNLVAVTPSGHPLGFGRLRAQDFLGVGVCVASYAVHEEHRRQGVGRTILAHLHTLSSVQERGLMAGVFADNEPSHALCRSYFGGELYQAEVEGREIVIFGDEMVKAAIRAAVEATR